MVLNRKRVGIKDLALASFESRTLALFNFVER